MKLPKSNKKIRKLFQRAAKRGTVVVPSNLINFGSVRGFNKSVSLLNGNRPIFATGFDNQTGTVIIADLRRMFKNPPRVDI